ncbi:hypothetical protein F25303_4237 [Fusarium sp. NRRL 25303]|nr:hypothetical protein F25303_4237 [Fusarium sp. NRRL 25303]
MFRIRQVTGEHRSTRLPLPSKLLRLFYQARSQVTADTVENEKTDYDDSPAKYLERQESMISHTDHDDIADLISQRQTPKEWLEALTKLYFADPASVFNHQSDFEDNVGEFVLCTGKDAFTVSAWPVAMGLEETPVLDFDNFHPGLLALEFFHGSKARPGPADEKAPKSSLPPVVLSIGRLLKGYTTESGISDSDETDYVLVVDAITPGHSVWLVYNRDSWDEEDYEPRIVDPTHRPLIFEGIGHNFDAAKIFPSVHDWVNSYGKVDFAKFEESIKATCITGAVQAKEILSSEVEVLLRQ